MKEYRQIPLRFLELSREQRIEQVLFEQKWQAPRSLAEKLGRTSDYVIKKIANDHAQNRSDWIKREVHGRNITTYYSPELVEVVLDELSQRRNPPAGWLTYPVLARITHKSITTIQKLWDKYRADNSSWFGIYLDSMGKLAEYCSPEVVRMAIEKYGGEQVAPPGWVTRKELSRKLGIHEKTLRRMLNPHQLSDMHSDWFKFYKTKNGHVIEHINPDLVTILQKDIDEIEPPPDGWLNANAIAKKLGKYHQAIMQIVEQYRANKSNWFKICKEPKKSGKRVCEYFSPELVRIICDEISNTKNTVAISYDEADEYLRQLVYGETKK